MAFTVGATLAKDSAGSAIPGGLLSADVAGGGVGPTFMFHGVVDGIAGSNKLGVYLEDAAAASDPTGTMLLAVRRDTLSASEVSADGDNIALKASSKGQMHVYAQIDTTQLGTLGPAAASASAPVVSQGQQAHDAADSNNFPMKGGHKATTSLAGLTLVSSADVTDSFAGVDGVQIVRPHCNLEDIVSGNATNTDGASTQCIAAQAAGIKTYLTSVVLCNTSATAITVDIKDGSTVKVSLPLPAGSGCIYNPPIPIPGTAATAWNFDGSAAATTVTCSMVGFKSKV